MTTLNFALITNVQFINYLAEAINNASRWEDSKVILVEGILGRINDLQ